MVAFVWWCWSAVGLKEATGSVTVGLEEAGGGVGLQWV